MPEIDWGRWLRPGDHLVCSHMAAEPVALLRSLARHAAPPAPLQLMLGVPFSMAAGDLPAHVALTTYGGMGTAAALAQRRPVALSLLGYGQSDGVYARGQWRCDIALVSLGRSADGQLFLSPSHGAVLAAARMARHILAQVSPNVPCVPGAEWPAELRIDQCLATEDAPLHAATAQPGEIEQAIARHIAALIPDGACLQVGIGNQPSAVLGALAGHRHLGVHTGMLTEPMWRLVQGGAADHSRKGRDAGVAVTGCVYGDAALYAGVHRHPGLLLRAPCYTHDAQVIAAQPDMACINSALEVDLLGSANAEAVVQADGRWRYVGGVGGLPDFVRAAVQAPRGQSIVALPSRTPKGQGRVVARLSGPATLAAADADVVVTEHGVARLRGRTVGERVLAMVAIAHPQDRDALRHEARSLGLL